MCYWCSAKFSELISLSTDGFFFASVFSSSERESERTARNTREATLRCVLARLCHAPSYYFAKLAISTNARQNRRSVDRLRTDIKRIIGQSLKRILKNKIVDHADTKRIISNSYMYFYVSFCLQGILTEMYSVLETFFFGDFLMRVNSILGL